MPDGVGLKGLDETNKELDAIARGEGAKRGVMAAAIYVKGKVATYPSPSRRPQPFRSDKSRRYFFAALKEGKINSPYQRGSSAGSERLGQSWTVEFHNDGLSATVGNDTSYGPLVMGRGTQAAYHRGTWPTVEDIGEQEQAAVERIILYEIERAVGGE